ncbi:MAG: hypothetical protein MR681_01330 [Prevotella sp.]|nr:hypothetical protein [Prevotella sp.]
MKNKILQVLNGIIYLSNLSATGLCRKSTRAESPGGVSALVACNCRVQASSESESLYQTNRIRLFSQNVLKTSRTTIMFLFLCTFAALTPDTYMI